MAANERIHTSALLKKQYPFGISKDALLTVAQETPVPVVFYSETELSLPEQELLMNAAIKGLKLHPAQFKVEVKVRKYHAIHFIVCGFISEEQRTIKKFEQIYEAPSVKEILSDLEMKKSFWELIKPIGGSLQ